MTVLVSLLGTPFLLSPEDDEGNPAPFMEFTRSLPSVSMFSHFLRTSVLLPFFTVGGWVVFFKIIHEDRVFCLTSCHRDKTRNQNLIQEDLIFVKSFVGGL